MDTTAAKSQAQSMRSSIVSFQMTPDLHCTAALDPDDAGETDGGRLPGSNTNRKKGRVVMVVVVEGHREGGNRGTSGDRHDKVN